MRAAIARHIRARAIALADELTDLIWSQMQRSLDDALDVARSALLSELAPLPPTVEVSPIAPVEQTPTTKRAPAAPPKPAPSPKREPPQKAEAPTGPRCGKCGKPGHNARSCGREPKGHRSVAERPAAALPPVAIKLDRFSKIEESAKARTGAGKRSNGISAEQAAARRVSGMPSVADEIATENPCRDESCRRTDLHAAHGEAA